MNQPHQQTDSSEVYYRFLNPNYLHIFSALKVLPLEDLVRNSDGKKIIADGKTLEATATVEDYQRLRDRLVDYLRDFRSGQSYGGVAINEVVNRFISILEYIKSLEERFRVDPERIEKLRFLVIKIFREKVGSGAGKYVPKTYLEIYKKADEEVLRGQEEAQKSRLQTIISE